MLTLIIKLLLPVVLIYFARRWLISTGAIAPPKTTPQGDVYPRKRRPNEQVIEICPECGNVLQVGHRCQ